MDDTAKDRRAIQSLLQQILMYRLAEYDSTMKSIDWSTIPKLPNPTTGEQEVIQVPPESFVDTLPAVLIDAPPLPGEETRYTQMLSVLDAAKNDFQLKAAMNPRLLNRNQIKLINLHYLGQMVIQYLLCLRFKNLLRIILNPYPQDAHYQDLFLKKFNNLLKYNHKSQSHL